MLKSEYKKMFLQEDKHFWFLARKNFLKSVLGVPQNKLQILDLGCGTGGASLFLGNWGNVTRIEYSPYAAEYLKRRRLGYINLNIEDYHFPADRFDIVCLLDVLYHKDITDYELVLDNAYKCLKKDGILVITDSALPYLSSKHDEVMKAKKRFYLSEIIDLVQNSGFTVEKKSYIFFLIFPLTFLIRIIDKVKRIDSLSKLPFILDKLLLVICTIEAELLKVISFPIGSSLIVRARKIR